MPPSLLKFKPIVLSKPWGGDGLSRVLGKGPAKTGMGESWELFDRAGDSSQISEGPLAGKTLHEWMEEFGREIPGSESENRNFPLLIKFISAADRLSVQVHPGAQSRKGEPKTEAWLVVEALPGAELILGVQTAGRDRGSVLEMLKSSRCEEVLRHWPAKAGDVFFVPAGTVHAITEGLLLYEIQQNSDTTYRLYDWGRVDVEGRSRPLHLQEAAEVADLVEREGYKIEPLRIQHPDHSEDFLLACPYFASVKWHGFRGKPVALEALGGFRVLSVIAGALKAKTGSESMQLNLGDTVLISPGSKVSLEASESTEFILSFIPDLEKDIRMPLLRAGHGEAEIARLSGPTGMNY